MKYTLKKVLEKPFLYSKNNIVTDINGQFEKFAGYTKEEIIGKSLTEVSKMLRMDSQIYLENIEDKYDCYIFTRKSQSREVTISCRSLEAYNEKTYFFMEKLDFRIEDRLPYVSSLILDNNIGTAIYSINEGLILKANKKFLEFMGISNNDMGNEAGKTLEEISAEYKGSNFEKMFLNVIRTGKAVHSKEVKYEHLERGETYWDISLVPVYGSGKVKYIVHTAYDITEKVSYRKLIEEENKELEAIIENMSDVLFTVDKDYNVTYLNNAAKEGVFKSDSIKKNYDTLKYNRYYDSEGNLLTFENLPTVRALRGEKLKDYRYTSHRPDGIYHSSFSGSPIYDNSGNIIKAIICSRDITEQVNREKVIRRQKEELEAILENMSDGLFIINKEGNYIVANKLARDILLIPSENYGAKDVYKQIGVLDDKGNPISYENFPSRKMMRGEKVSAQRYTIKQKDKLIYIEVNAVPIYDKEENFVAGVACLRDVTEQVNKDELIKMQKDELIRMQKNELSAIIENMSDGLFTVDKNHKITLLNESAKEFFWNSGAAEVPKNAHTPKKYYDSQGNLLTFETMPAARIFKGESIKEYRITCDRPDGIYHFNVSGSPICDKDGNIEKVLVCSRNQTEAVKNVEMIKMQNDQLEAIIENIYDCLLVFNKDGNIIKYSKTAEDHIENHWKIITINDYFRHMQVSDLNGSPLSEEFSFVTRIVNGEKILGYKFAVKIDNAVSYFELNGNPIYDSKGSFVAGVIIIRDITKEVKYKSKMEETLKVQDEVFANISHELKTPLNVIYSTNQLIELYLKNGSFEANKEKISKSLNVIKQNCYRFSKLINNIVDLSKIDSGFLKLNPVNENIVRVVEDIAESVSEYIKGKGINIVFDTSIEEKIIACDPEKIERIILNLISNAIKFTSSGGTISVDLIDRGETVEIAVKDTGAGIDKKHLDNIFKRFYQADKSLTRNAEGSGIGLSLVKSLVELHGGKISIESMVGEGSVFKIELPSRIIEEDEEAAIDKIMPKDNKVEMINIEFSDIYSI